MRPVPLDRPGFWLGLLFCSLLAAACGESKTAAARPEPRAAYESELRTLEAAIEDAKRLVDRQKDDSLLPLEAVALYLERARLTGDYRNYEDAESMLAVAGARATRGVQPCLAQARLHYTLHRLKQAAAALDTCAPNVEPSEIAGLRADIAFHSGRYAEAEGVYRALVNQVGLPQHYIRLALYRSKTGSPGEAAALLEAAERRYHGTSATMKSWLKLQRGLIALDRGRFDEALALYRLASDALPGWWLIDEHIAEIQQLRGDTKAAKALYEDVIRRTGSPEFMDALAAIHAGEGRADEARRLLERARPIYEKRIERFPEAAAGHALRHFLLDPASAKRALLLARKNFETRPHGEAAIALARALMLNGEPKPAVSLLEAQASRGWDTAELHWVLGEALMRAGLRDRALGARSQALQRNAASAAMYATPER